MRVLSITSFCLLLLGGCDAYDRSFEYSKGANIPCVPNEPVISPDGKYVLMVGRDSSREDKLYFSIQPWENEANWIIMPVDRFSSEPLSVIMWDEDNAVWVKDSQNIDHLHKYQINEDLSLDFFEIGIDAADLAPPLLRGKRKRVIP